MENSSNNYPKITHLGARRGSFKVDPKDPNFDKPLADLEKTYEHPHKRIVISKPEYGEFQIIVCV